jgi:hypothetical protein
MISYEQYIDYSPYFAQIDIEAPSSRAEFLELFNKTPQLIKNWVTSTETAELLLNMGISFKLDEYDTEAIAYVIRQIVVGEIPLIEAPDTIAQEIKISPNTAREILGACLRDILTPVLEEVKKIQAARFPNITPQTKNQNMANLQKSFAPSADVNPSNIVDLRTK